ncbi:MAG: MMPL family transporter [Planctomycetaceae bacterium]|nr:MMPL family transporter [Planctomycetaceae bacterium]
MKLLAEICVERRAIGWLVVLLLSVPPILGVVGWRIAEPLPSGWVAPEVIEELRAAEEQFQASASLVLVLECDDFFQADRVAALRDTVADLRELPSVRYLAWPGDVQEISLFGRRTDLLPATESEDPVDWPSVRERLVSHPLVAGNLMSRTGTTMLVVMDVVSRTDTPTIRQVAVSGLAPAGIRTRVTGTMALYDVHDRALQEDHLRIQLLAYCLVGFLQLVIFRRPIAIIVACAGPVVGVAWTMGWLLLIGQAENELAKIILPVMVIMIGFTDGVHLIVRLRQLRAVGRLPADSVRQAILQTGPACFLTSVTTAIGFGSLMMSQSDMIAGFGRASAIGVVVTFLAVVIVSPLLAMSAVGQRMHVSAHSDPLARLMKRLTGIVSFSSRFARSVTITGIVVTGLCLVASSQLVPDDRVSDRVPQDCEEWQAMHHCDRNVGGIRSARLMIGWPEDASRREIWEVVRRGERLLSEQQAFSNPQSIRTAMTVVKRPPGKEVTLFVSRLPESLKRRYFREDIRTALVTARMQDLGFAGFAPVFAQVERQLKQLQTEYPLYTFDFYSDVVVEGRVVSQMIHEMMDSLMMAAVIIFGILAVGFGSLRTGLISIIPNLMPLAVSGAIRLWLGSSMGVAGACSFAICLGIAVDDTIHYLWHFRHERRRGATALQANQATFVTVGSALLMTTVVMTAGLGTVLTSRLPPHVNFAAMAVTTLAVALPADLLFLPALLTLFPGRVAGDDATQPPNVDPPGDVD